VPTRNVVLTQHQAELIEKLVESGRYQNASEVLRDGLRLVESRDTEERTRIKALRAAVQVGVADIEAGRFRTFDAPGALRRHLSSIADSVIEDHRRNKKRK
jgi:antitoxin ParD1/3/4